MTSASLPVRCIATWFGCGYSPVAPGTVGSLGTLPLCWLLGRLGAGPYAVATLLLTLLGIWAGDRMAQALGDEDPSAVVIDEVVGTLLAVGIAGRGGVIVPLLAFAAFRFFDIKKPWLIDRVQELRPPGLGIMADDVLAGIAAGGLVRLGVTLLGV
jgi:phosphatidylglycerophosphatase A